MLLSHKPLWWVANALLVSWAAEVGGVAFAVNPYEAIYHRNLFRLRAPPIIRVEPKKAPLPRIRLTGITTILRGKRALLEVEFPVKPPARPKIESFILTEGESAGPIEVLEINEKAAQVRVDNSGIVTNLSFEKIPPATPSASQPKISSPWQRPAYRGISH
jgi:hypothetical protein